MLYATTRNNADGFTAQRVLTAKRGPDGGLFVPFRIPQFSEEEILALGRKSFNSTFSDLLNLLFNTHLTAYDIDFTVGRSSVRLQQLGQKILMGECWHNTQWQFSRLVKDISQLLLTEKNADPEITGWAEIGIRIAVLFGIFGELIRQGLAGGDRKIDISMVSGDFSAPMSAWYARAMGLPVGNLICCCNENSSLWDFVCHGQLRTDGVAVSTVVPQGDVVVPEGLERLISIYGGPEETDRYVQTVRRGNTYYADDGFLQRLRQGIYVTVSSEKRILSTIPSAWATHRYLLSPAGALTYAGLQDYRARTGVMRTALVMTEESPVCSARTTAEAMGLSEEAIKQILK